MNTLYLSSGVVGEIGEISVRKDNLEIYESVKDDRFQLVINFIEYIMQRTGSACAVVHWFRQLCIDNRFI